MNEATPFEVGISHQIGRYSDAVRVPTGHDIVIVSGTPGITPEGELPEGIVEQSQQAWANVEAALQASGAELTDIVAVRQWLVSAEDKKAYVDVRSSVLLHKPTFMLGVISELIRPGILVEVEVVAAVKATA